MHDHLAGKRRTVALHVVAFGTIFGPLIVEWLTAWKTTEAPLVVLPLLLAGGAAVVVLFADAARDFQRRLHERSDPECSDPGGVVDGPRAAGDAGPGHESDAGRQGQETGRR